MSEKRRYERITCSNKCHLNFNGKKYRGVIEDLSRTGARLKLTARNRPDLSQGGQCSLIINNDPQFICGEFSGKIVRCNSTRIGLQFQF